MTWETVPIETFARSAICRIVTGALVGFQTFKEEILTELLECRWLSPFQIVSPPANPDFESTDTASVHFLPPLLRTFGIQNHLRIALSWQRLSKIKGFKAGSSVRNGRAILPQVRELL